MIVPYDTESNNHKRNRIRTPQNLQLLISEDPTQKINMQTTDREKRFAKTNILINTDN